MEDHFKLVLLILRNTIGNQSIKKVKRDVEVE